MRTSKIKCILGFHKWDDASTILPVHEREEPESVFGAMVYGSSKFYHYECERCGKKQWVSENYNTWSGYSKRKINYESE